MRSRLRSSTRRAPHRFSTGQDCGTRYWLNPAPTVRFSGGRRRRGGVPRHPRIPAGDRHRPDGRRWMDRPLSTGLVQLQAGEAFAVVDTPEGGRLASLVIGGHELLVRRGRDLFHWGSFPMAPWVGRLRHGTFQFEGDVVRLPRNAEPHALHGLVTDRTWRVASADKGSVNLTIDVSRGHEDPWPWPFRVVQSVSLQPDRIDFSLELFSEQRMPADIGWHPWFVRDLSTADGQVSLQLDVDPGEVYLNDMDGLPSGELGAPPPRPWDYCFTGLTRAPIVRWPGLLELTIDSNCQHWVLYDVEPDGVCVEPWTGPPNSLNGPSPTVVTPACPLRATMSWTWQQLCR